MINRARIFIVHGQDPVAWAERYGIEPFSVECESCGRLLTTSVPFAQGQLRGLEVPRCSCGNKQSTYCLVRDPKHGDLFTRGLQP